MNRSLGMHERTQTEGCFTCFWLNDTSCSNKTKCALVCCATALTVIVLLGTLLVFLAQKGYAPTALSFIANRIDPVWLFTSFALASLAFLIDALFVATLSCSKETNNKPSIEYSQQLGESLVAHATGDLEWIKSIEANLLRGEYWDLQKIVTGKSAYPEVHPILTKDTQGNLKRHFFKTEEAADSFKENLSLKNDALRHQYSLHFVQGAAYSLYEQGLPPSQPLYFIEKYPSSGVAHRITYSQKAGLSSQLLPLESLTEEIGTLKGYTEIDSERWLTTPLAQAERDFLKRRIFDVSIEFWLEEKRLKQEEFVVRNYGRYVALIIQHIEEAEVKFYKVGDPNIQRDQLALQHYKDRSYINPFPTHRSDTSSPTYGGS